MTCPRVGITDCILGIREICLLRDLHARPNSFVISLDTLHPYKSKQTLEATQRCLLLVYASTGANDKGEHSKGGREEDTNMITIKLIVTSSQLVGVHSSQGHL